VVLEWHAERLKSGSLSTSYSQEVFMKSDDVLPTTDNVMVPWSSG